MIEFLTLVASWCSVPVTGATGYTYHAVDTCRAKAVECLAYDADKMKDCFMKIKLENL